MRRACGGHSLGALDTVSGKDIRALRQIFADFAVVAANETGSAATRTVERGWLLFDHRC